MKLRSITVECGMDHGWRGARAGVSIVVVVLLRFWHSSNGNFKLDQLHSTSRRLVVISRSSGVGEIHEIDV